MTIEQQLAAALKGKTAYWGPINSRMSMVIDGIQNNVALGINQEIGRVGVELNILTLGKYDPIILNDDNYITEK